MSCSVIIVSRNLKKEQPLRMDIKKRLLRKPLLTALWSIVTAAATLLICIGTALWYSTARLPDALDKQQTTIAVMTSRYIKDDNSVTYTPVAIYEDTVNEILAIPSVKGIDFRTLSGAYIDKLDARIGLVKWGNTLADVDWTSGWFANSTYDKVVFSGTVERTWIDKPNNPTTTDLTKIGYPENMTVYYSCALINVDKAHVIAKDYPLFESDDYDDYDGRIRVMFPMLGEGENYFEVGKRYVIRGSYDPSCSARSYVGSFDDSIPLRPNVGITRLAQTRSPILDCLIKDDSLVFYRNCDVSENLDPERGEVRITVNSVDYPVPYATKWDGSIDDLMKKDENWARIVKEYEMTLHSFPVLGTEKLESMYMFVNNSASITEGRFFTDEEYARGEKVVILNRTLAENAGVKVGDRLSLSQFKAANDKTHGNYSVSWDAEDYDMLMLFNNPALGFEPFSMDTPHEAEEFTVVGLYTLENEWQNSAFSVTPNTVFIPKKAQIEDSFGGMSRELGLMDREVWFPDENGELVKKTVQYEVSDYGGVQGVYMSVILKNGSMDEFLESVKNNPRLYNLLTLNNDGFLTFDQGFDRAKEGIEALQSSSLKLMLICAAGAVMLLLLFIILYQGTERRALGILRSVGAQVGTTRRYLFFSGLIIIVAGTIIGILLSNVFSSTIREKLVDFTVAHAAKSAHSGGFELDAGSLSGMMTAGSLPLPCLAAIGCAGALITAAVAYIHAAILAKKKPRKLLGV